MKLLTKAILKKLPPMRSQEHTPSDQVRIPVKFFNPTGAGTWYATEYDPDTRMFFGYAHITDGELGYFSLDELEAFRGRFGLGIERDAHWDSTTTLKTIMDRGY